MRGSLLFTIATLLVAEALFLFFMITGYYDSVEREVEAQLLRVYNQLEPLTGSTEAKAVQLRAVVEQFEDKARFELMLIDVEGNIVSSSSGVAAGATGVAEDVAVALGFAEGAQPRFVGQNENEEKVMAMTRRTPFVADGIVAIRVATSLRGVDRQILNLVLLSVMFILVVIVASIVSGVYFIRSIVLPLQKVEATATRIAEGDFETRIENQADDEIGSLCKTINHMAEELGKSERMKNDFISSVSHELRTPLTSIKGWVETVGGIADAQDPNHRRGVEIIAGEADRLYDMVEELLDFSRMQQGLTLAPELLDLAAEVEEAVLQQARRAERLGLAIAFEPPEEPVPVMADKNRIRQVMINVLDNAIKYSGEGGEVGVEILTDAANAFVVVKDEGQGISPADLEHVKTRFYKGAGAVRGSGIGLAVVDEILQAHEGALEIASELGVGTEVTLRLPLHTLRQNPKGETPKEI